RRWSGVVWQNVTVSVAVCGSIFVWVRRACLYRENPFPDVSQAFPWHFPSLLLPPCRPAPCPTAPPTTSPARLAPITTLISTTSSPPGRARSPSTSAFPRRPTAPALRPPAPPAALPHSPAARPPLDPPPHLPGPAPACPNLAP
ncbi:hypothetical protein C8J57DRAFT_1349594, partial [Mycena rebaudengoi]